MKNSNNCRLFLISLIFFFISLRAIAQELPSDTPNLSPQNNIWTQTSPQTQLVLGIGDLVLLGTVQLVEDPEFRVANRKYGKASRSERAAKTKYENIQKEINAEEKSLDDLNASRKGAESELASQSSLISIKEETLEKNKNILTLSEKETRLNSIKARMQDLTNQALKNHRGRIDSLDEVYGSLPSGQKTEMDNLLSENNSIHDMPDVNRTEKIALITKSEEDLSSTRAARDLTLENIQKIQQAIFNKSADIQKLRPGLQSAETALKEEETLTNLAKTEMTLIAEKKGMKRLGYKVLRRGGDVIFAIDFGARLMYYFVWQQDPGWLPFGKVLQKL